MTRGECQICQLSRHGSNPISGSQNQETKTNQYLECNAFFEKIKPFEAYHLASNGHSHGVFDILPTG